MKKILLAVATSAAVFAALPAQAIPVTANFSVTVTLTPVCTVTSVLPVLAFGTYTAFGGAVVATPANVTLSCTRGAVVPGTNTASFDTALPDASGDAASASPTGQGIIAGLLYTLTATASIPTPGVAPVLPSTPGTADQVQYAIAGNMIAGQPGQLPVGPLTQARTLTINY